MRNKTLGSMMAGAITALIANATLAGEITSTPDKVGASTNDEAKGELVKCYSESCGGKFEYKGQKNNCAGESQAIEVPKKLCDPKKGLKIVSK